MNGKLRQSESKRDSQKEASAGACFRSRRSPEQKPRGRKVRLVTALPSRTVSAYSLNPYAVNTSPLQAVWGSIMEPLIDADYEKRRYRGILAESWQMKGTKLQFKLRKGIRFHDGAQFTSRDVLASFKRILSHKQSLQAPNLQNIAEMDAPDEHTVILTLKKADAIRSRGHQQPRRHETVDRGKDGRSGQSTDRNRSIRISSWERSGQFVLRRNRIIGSGAKNLTKSFTKRFRKTGRASPRSRRVRRI